VRVVTFKAPQELVEKIDDFAKAHGMTRSKLIRVAIKELIEKELPEQQRELGKIKAKRMRL